jgi:hypothetical protein
VTPEQTAAATRAALDTVAQAWIKAPRTLRQARELGLSGWVFTVAGRSGALGDVSPEVAAAAMGLIAPAAVRDAFETAGRVLAVSQLARQRIELVAHWGREELSGVDAGVRFAALAERVIAAVDASALPLFAAWRAMPAPDSSSGARAAVAAYTLMEFRASADLVAFRVAGLTPVLALLSGPEGEAGAVAYGWAPPFPSIGHLGRRRAWADAVSDRIVGEALSTLDAVERHEWQVLVASLARKAQPSELFRVGRARSAAT